MSLALNNLTIFVGKDIPVSATAGSVVRIESLCADGWASNSNGSTRNSSGFAAKIVDIKVVVFATNGVEGESFWAGAVTDVLV